VKCGILSVRPSFHEKVYCSVSIYCYLTSVVMSTCAAVVVSSPSNSSTKCICPALYVIQLRRHGHWRGSSDKADDQCSGCCSTNTSTRQDDRVLSRQDRAETPKQSESKFIQSRCYGRQRHQGLNKIMNLKINKFRLFYLNRLLLFTSDFFHVFGTST